jgi:hypothetical protein
MGDSSGDFAKHSFIEKIVFRTVEGHPRDAGVNAEFHMLELFRFAALRLGSEVLCIDRLNHFWHP